MLLIMPSKKLANIEPLFGAPLRVKYKDVFDLKAFYESLHDWLLHNNWVDVEEKKDHYENFYGERIGREGAKEIWIQWRPFKEAEGAPITYYLDFDFHVLGLSNVEVVKEGIKMKVQKGELDLYITPYIQKNYEEKFSKHPFLKQILPIFNKRIYREQYEQRRKELYNETYILQNFIKQWFKLKRYAPYEETKSFFTSQAWPSHLKE